MASPHDFSSLDPSLLSTAQPHDDHSTPTLAVAPSFGKKKPTSSATGSSSARGSGRKHMSCQGCKSRKMKCSRQANCAGCVMRGEPCIWLGGAGPGIEASPPGDSYASELSSAQAEIQRLRKLVELLLLRLDSRQAGLAAPSPIGSNGYPLPPPPPPPGYAYHNPYGQQYHLPPPGTGPPPQLSLQVPITSPAPYPSSPTNKAKKRSPHSATLDSAEALLSLANSPTTPSTASKSPSAEANALSMSSDGVSVAGKALEKSLQPKAAEPLSNAATPVGASATPPAAHPPRAPYPPQVYIDPSANPSGPASPMKKSPDAVPSHEARYDAAVAAMHAKRGTTLSFDLLPPLPLGSNNGRMGEGERVEGGAMESQDKLNETGDVDMQSVA